MDYILSNGWLSVPVLIVALADWIAVARRIQWLEYVCKPLTMVSVIALTWLLFQGTHDNWQAQWFFLGFVFSLVGDVLLMLPGVKHFVRGLVAFLLAHVWYTVGLNESTPPFGASSLIVLALIAVAGILLFRRIAAGLQAHGPHQLLVPVAIYSLVISVMLFSAWNTLFRPDWGDVRRLLVISGASLFFASDAMLAWDRFVQRSHPLHVAVIVAYHLGQLALALSLAA